MWKLTLLVAIVAYITTSNAESYSCYDNQPDSYSSECTEIQSGYDFATLRKLVEKATSTLSGTCIYQLTRLYKEQSQLTSVAPLTNLLSQLALNAAGSTRSQFYNIINLEDSKQVRYTIPKMPTNVQYKNFVSKVSSIAFTRSSEDFSQHFKSCFRNILGGNTRAVDFSNSKKAASTINSWFSSQTSQNENIISAADIRDDTGMIFATSHYVEVGFNNFAFNSKETIDYKTSDGSTVPLEVYVGEGLGKYSYNKKLKAQVIELSLTGDHYAVIIQPEVGCMEQLLFKLRDTSIAASLNDNAKTEYLHLSMPIIENQSTSENYAEGMQLANLLPAMFDSDYNEFKGIYSNKSGHVTHMFHKLRFRVKPFDGRGSTATKSRYSSSRKVVVNGPMVYYVFNSKTRTPLTIGTFYGTN